MSFLNAMLLGGGLAFTLPLLIHLLSREKFQSLDWGAMQWLESTEPVNSRSPHWSTWLLLLNRIAIPIFLAACLARPVLTAFRTPVASENSALSIVIDNSLSMKARNPGTGQTAFDQAKQLIVAALEYEQARGQLLEVSVFTTTDTAPVLDTTTVVGRARSVVNELVVVHHANLPGKSIRAATNRLRESEAPRHRLLLISDFQSNKWKSAKSEIASLVRPDGLATEQTPTPPLEVVLAQVAHAASQTNVSIHADVLPTLLPNMPVLIRARVVGLAEGAASTATVFVDGQQLRRQRVVGNAGSDVYVEFACQFTETGDHRVKLQLDCVDSIQDDNTAYLAVRVARAQKVALLANSNSQPVLDFVETALAPYADSGRAQNRFRTQRIATHEVTPTTLSIDEYETAILVLGGPLSETASDALLDFVHSGRGLIAFPGADVATDWWNHLAGSSQPLFALRYTGSDKLEAEGLVIASGLPGPLASLGGLKSSFTQVRLQQASRLLPRSSELQESAIPILLTPAGPALVTRAFGKGRVLQFSFSPGREWTNLQVLPGFVPLMQELAVFASQAERSRRNVFAGEDFTQPSRDGKRKLEPIDVSVPSDGQPASEVIHYSGIYEVADFTDKATREPVLLAAQIPSEESPMEPLSEAELDKWADVMKARQVTTANEFSRSETQLRDGKEVWRWFLLGVICLLASEIWLSGQITRGGQ